MRYFAVLLLAVPSYAVTLTGTIQADLDTFGDGGATALLQGPDLFASLDTWPGTAASILNCDMNAGCSFTMLHSGFRSLATGTVTLNGITGGFFDLSMTGASGYLQGRLDLYTPNSVSILASTPVDAYYASGPASSSQGVRSRTIALSDQPFASAGGEPVPEPRYEVPLLLLLMLPRRRSLLD